MEMHRAVNGVNCYISFSESHVVNLRKEIRMKMNMMIAQCGF